MGGPRGDERPSEGRFVSLEGKASPRQKYLQLWREREKLLSDSFLFWGDGQGCLGEGGGWSCLLREESLSMKLFIHIREQSSI